MIQHDENLWKQILENAKLRALKGLNQKPLWIRGYESNPKLIQPIKNNIERAGLST